VQTAAECLAWSSVDDTSDKRHRHDTETLHHTHTHTHTQQQQSASCIYPQLNVNVKVVYSKTFTIIMTKCFVTIQLNCKVQATYRQHHQD